MPNIHDWLDGSIGGAVVAIVWIIVHYLKGRQQQQLNK